MTKNTSVSLGEHYLDFVEQQVGQGHCASASEVVRARLRLLEEHEIRLAALRAALIEGERSGQSESFNFDRFLAGKHAARAK